MKIFAFTIILVILTALNTASAQNKSDEPYLLKPTDNYGVGYQDLDVINKNICPDKFYKHGVNEADFSPINTSHCHEILLRIYYPSIAEISMGDKYYWPALENKWLENYYKLTQPEIKTLRTNKSMRTYTFRNASPIRQKKFPVVIFMAGSGQPVQTYNNIISQVVSHGYIVIGINSVFANGQLLLPNDHLVLKPKQYNDAARIENLNDLSFILNKLSALPYQHGLKNMMDFHHIGLLGHSMGAMNIANLPKQSGNNHAQAIILMDPGNVLWKANYPLTKSPLPTLVLWSSYFKHASTGDMLLGKNDYSVELKPAAANSRFSNHENFSDLSTLQYHPAYKIQKIHDGLTKSNFMGLGTGSGYKISEEINEYILQFLNLFLKKIPSRTFAECEALSKESVLSCGNQPNHLINKSA